MTKPLELTWYERDEDGDYAHPAGYLIPETDVDDWNEWKRLTDAEVAADYWGLRAMLDGGLVTSHDRTIPWRNDGCQPIRESMTKAGKKIRKQVDTLLRFAMQPSAHESDYQ